jgi:hypothetical protein
LQEIINGRRVVPAGILEFHRHGKAKTADIARGGAIPARRPKICTYSIIIPTRFINRSVTAGLDPFGEAKLATGETSSVNYSAGCGPVTD